MLMASQRRGHRSAATLESDFIVQDNGILAVETTEEGVPLLAGTASTMEDRYSIAYLIFYLLGLGSLLPWNFFITAKDYWMYKLGDFNTSISPGTVSPGAFSDVTVEPANNSSTTQSNNAITRLQGLFMNSLAVCAMLPNVVFQFLNTLLQKRVSQNVRILSTLGLMIVLFIFTEILVETDTSSWQETFFVVTLVTVVILNTCSAICQSSSFGLAAQFPWKFSAAVMAGQGMGGVFAAVAMIIALAFSSNPTTSALIFFLTAITVLAATMVCYLLLIKLKFYKFYTTPASDRKFKREDFTVESASNVDDQERQFLSSESINYDPTSENGEVNSYTNSADYSVPVLHIARKIWLHLFCVAYTFFITLACFPAVTASIKPTSTGSAWTDVYFTPVCCFLFYNLFDWAGRMLAMYIHVPSPRNRMLLLVCVLLRTVFPFLFAFCNYQPRRYLRVVFQHDWCFIVFMILFAISNGHLSTLSMQYGPKLVEPENSATAGSMLAFMISAGLFAGAGTSFLVTSLI